MDLSWFRGRPLVARRRLGPWLVLLATLPLGLKAYADNWRIGLSTWNPGGHMGLNARTYHYAAELARAGEGFYDVAPPGTYDWAVYLYPPITTVAYYPLTIFEWTTAYAGVVALSVLAAVGTTAVIVSYVESLDVELGWLDVALILAALLLSTHAFGTIFYGNINLLLALSVAVGFWALARDREAVAGVVFALPALFKVFPAVVGLWLLRTRRLRAALAATAVGLAGLIAGLALFGVDATVYYFTDVLVGRGGSSQFVGGYPVDGTYYLTIQQPLSHWLWLVWPDAPYEALAALAVLVSVTVLAYFYRDVETTIDRLMAIYVTLVLMVVVFPALRWYVVLLYLPLTALLYVWERGPGRRAFLAGAVLVSLTYSSGEVVEWLDWLPGPLYEGWYAVAGTAVPPLYGLVLTVAACAWYRYRRASATTASADTGVSSTTR